MKTLLLAVLIAAPLAARDRIVDHPAPASVMWIAAHPDDEAVVAPLLSSWCRDAKRECTFVLATRGEAGSCLLADGCAPDVATVRSAEAGAASQHFGANSVLLALPDGGVHVSAALVARIAKIIDAFDPDVVLTFDPRHGTTCHPDHRAIGQIVLDAVALLDHRPTVYLVETKLDITLNPLSIHFRSAAPASAVVERFDGNWNAIVDDMRNHPSQFDESWIRAIENVPLSERGVFIAPADAILREPVAGCN